LVLVRAVFLRIGGFRALRWIADLQPSPLRCLMPGEPLLHGLNHLHSRHIQLGFFDQGSSPLRRRVWLPRRCSVRPFSGVGTGGAHGEAGPQSPAGDSGYPTGSSAEAGSRGLLPGSRTRLVTLANWLKARSASTVKIIACAAAIQNPVFAPVSQTSRLCASYDHTRVKMRSLSYLSNENPMIGL